MGCLKKKSKDAGAAGNGAGRRAGKLGTVKIITFGQGGVGKTSIFVLINKEQLENQGTDLSQTAVTKLNQVQYKWSLSRALTGSEVPGEKTEIINFNDTAGQDLFRNLRKLSYIHAMVALYVVSLEFPIAGWADDDPNNANTLGHFLNETGHEDLANTRWILVFNKEDKCHKDNTATIQNQFHEDLKRKVGNRLIGSLTMSAISMTAQKREKLIRLLNQAIFNEQIDNN